MRTLPQSFTVPGKVMLAGEYFVLGGGVSLMLPTQFSQEMTIRDPRHNNQIEYNARDEQGNIFFNSVMSFREGEVQSLSFSDKETNDFLISLFRELSHKDLLFCGDIETKMNFSPLWGIGSSASLMALLAKSFNCPWKDLLKHISGSGADVACSFSGRSLFYQRKNEEEIILSPCDFNPSFKDSLYFVHLNKKISTEKDISGIVKNYFLDLRQKNPELIKLVSSLVKSLGDYQDNFKKSLSVLRQLDNLTAKGLQRETLQNSHFADFPGLVKYLGSWGGDFALVMSEDLSSKEVSEYFAKRGYKFLLRYDEMIKKDQ